mgnify:CR=1 FL=1
MHSGRVRIGATWNKIEMTQMKPRHEAQERMMSVGVAAPATAIAPILSRMMRTIWRKQTCAPR